MLFKEKAKHSVSITNLIVPGSICAIAADAKSPDTLWFVKIDSSKSKATFFQMMIMETLC